MINPRELRNAFGSFLTGVTVVTTLDRSGCPRGFTANSFTSVSIDPPLLLVCIAKTATSYTSFVESGRFAVNILAETQREVSTVFASKTADKFDAVAWRAGTTGSPLLDDVVAWFDCRTDQEVDAGDHIVLIGRVEEFSHAPAAPLGYVRGAYFAPGLERDAIAAASRQGSIVVGALLDCDGRIVLLHDRASDTFHLPEAEGPAGFSSLRQRLDALGLKANLSFVFAVFDEERDGRHFVYYRGTAAGAATSSDCHLFFAKNIPWDRIRDQTTETMIRRYFAEREEGSFGVYSGIGDTGLVARLARESIATR
jgi:flavin reductase (DIM6/NTAB) family NADH-FMN oxidoreductase RutF